MAQWVELCHCAKFYWNCGRDVAEILRFFDFSRWQPSASLNLWRACLDYLRRVFIAVQHLVGVGTVVLKICEFQYYASSFAWKCLFTPLLGEFLGVKIGVTGNFLQFYPSRNVISWHWDLTKPALRFGLGKWPKFGVTKEENKPTCRDAPSVAIALNFGMLGDVADLITHAKFYANRFGVFGVLILQFCHSP